MRLDPRLRFWTYTAFAALLVTGAIWLAADKLKTSENGEMWQAIAAKALTDPTREAETRALLRVQRSWRAGKNRITGSVMAATNAVLAVTASGLYYAGSEEWRALIADVHIATGFALPALIVTHIALGRRARTAVRQTHSRPVEISAAMRAVTFSEDP